jgi:hypothetical protein
MKPKCTQQTTVYFIQGIHDVIYTNSMGTKENLTWVNISHRHRPTQISSGRVFVNHEFTKGMGIYSHEITTYLIRGSKRL